MAKSQQPSQPERVSGKIVKLVADKGFGFIVDDHGTEYFFHRSALTEEWGTLQPQQRVTFTVDHNNPKGPRAEQVRLGD